MKVFCGFEAVSLVFVIAGILSVRSPEVKLPVGVSSDSCEQSEGAKDGQWVLKCKLEQEDVHDVPIKVPRRNKCLQMSLRLSMSCEGIFRCTCGQAALRSLALLQQQRKDMRQRLSEQLGKCRQMQGKVKDAEGAALHAGRVPFPGQQALLLERLRPLQSLLDRG